ncbi:flavin-binding monooxygenase-like family protein [Mycena rosella]|uniref:Flavin-binding monooxygenase-like family protein n=1 Tax=Mycena rosella TaxID=1033263 RepID=A0AAD7MAY1_MYCRO|nr:flavin-binding monooxygenase-like family protein [Mycena rosella]
MEDAGVAVSDPVIRQRYIEERNKRRRPEGVAQFINLSEIKSLPDDPWVDHAALNAKTPALNDGDEVKFLVLGAGFGGLVIAAHLVEAGFSPADIRLVDDAGGFGGTWYWNRYPGLMCDVESYIYMPLLEETGYMPRFKYSYGTELQEHAERIAAKWELSDKALFRTQCHDAEWDDTAKRWILQVTEYRGPAEPKREIRLRAQYVFMASGALNAPHIPRLPGFEDFRGQHFHTSRWDYGITGGSEADWTLENLKDKTVGIIGTGATAIQVIPQLANWAKQLVVFQRTPSSVDVRNQRPTDPDEWTNKIASTKGWQRTRSDNFNSYLVNTPIGEDLVNDSWCRMSAYCGLIGLPGIVSPDKIPEHIAKLHAYDLERAERIRARTSEVVKDPETAEKLKHWYPAWCKRPTFHDDYLPAFNQPNVTLVDTDGKGVEMLTSNAVVANGTSYPVDVLILSTGFGIGKKGTGSPAAHAGVKIVGRDGLSMDDKWKQDGASTLHGVSSNSFPNLFFLGPSQIGITANFTFTLSLLASHIAAVVAEAERQVDRSDRLTIEVTKDAEDAWGENIMMRAGAFAGLSGCTPSYINREGATDNVVEMQKKIKDARGAPWGEGILSFVEVLRAWRAEGGLQGFQIKTK